MPPVPASRPARAATLRAVLLGALVLLAAVVPYLPTLRYEFVWDDRLILGPELDVRGPGDLARIWATPFDSLLRATPPQRSYFRPVVLYTLAADRALYGDRAAGYHATNVLWYALACLFLWLLAWQVSGRPAAAAAGAALFALHPAHPESVAFVSGRTDVIAGTFLFAALWTAARWGPRIAVAWRKLLPASLALLPGLFSKEIVLFAAPLLPLALWLVERRLRAREVAAAALPVAGAVALYLACRVAAIGTAGGPAVPPVEGTWPQVLTSVAVVARYVPLLFAPLHLSARHEIVEARTPLDPVFLAGVVVLAAAVVAFVAALRRRSRWALPLALLALTLLPVCWVRILSGAIVAERFLFLPGGAIALAVALAPVPLPALLGGTAVAAAAFGAILAVRVPVWRDQGTLFESMLRDSPESTRVHAILGTWYYERRDLRRAVYHNRRAFELDPRSVESLLRSAAAQAEMGQADSALTAVLEVVRLRPDMAPAWYALGNLYAGQGRRDVAAYAYRHALLLAPDYAEAQNNLGAMLELSGRTEEALSHYRRAVEIRPGYREARNNLERLSAEAARRAPR